MSSKKSNCVCKRYDSTKSADFDEKWTSLKRKERKPVRKHYDPDHPSNYVEDTDVSDESLQQRELNKNDKSDHELESIEESEEEELCTSTEDDDTSDSSFNPDLLSESEEGRVLKSKAVIPETPLLKKYSAACRRPFKQPRKLELEEVGLLSSKPLSHSTTQSEPLKANRSSESTSSKMQEHKSGQVDHKDNTLKIEQRPSDSLPIQRVFTINADRAGGTFTINEVTADLQLNLNVHYSELQAVCVYGSYSNFEVLPHKPCYMFLFRARPTDNAEVYFYYRDSFPYTVAEIDESYEYLRDVAPFALDKDSKRYKVLSHLSNAKRMCHILQFVSEMRFDKNYCFHSCSLEAFKLARVSDLFVVNLSN